MNPRTNKRVALGLASAGLLPCLLVGLALAAPSGSGEEIYQFYCAQCHGVKADGKGVNATEDLPTAPKDFTSPKTLPIFTDEQIVKTIVHGGPVEQLSFIMPSWGAILGDDEVELLRAHLRKVCNCVYDAKAAAAAAAEAAAAEAAKK